jgi:hypothetical protein
LTPFTKDGFFQYGNEKADIFFKAEGGKMVILVVPYNQKPIPSAERVLAGGKTGN